MCRWSMGQCPMGQKRQGSHEAGDAEVKQASGGLLAAYGRREAVNRASRGKAQFTRGGKGPHVRVCCGEGRGWGEMVRD